MTDTPPWPAPEPGGPDTGSPFGFAPGPPPPPTIAPPRGPHDTLPFAVGIGAMVVLAASLVLSKIVLDLVVDQGWPTFVYIVIVVAVGYGPSLVWWRYASDRWGTGSAIDDAGVRPAFADLGWGPVIWVAALLAQGALNSLVIGLDLPFSNNTDDIGELSADRAYTVSIVVAAVIAAPVVEEIVFRGLLMRSLLSKLPVLVVLPVQGILFGAAHADPARGSGNIGLVFVLSGIGIVFGAAAYLLRRVGPTVVAHAILNAVVMFLVLSGTAERLQEDSPFDVGGSVLEQVAVVDQAHVVEPDGRGDPDPIR